MPSATTCRVIQARQPPSTGHDAELAEQAMDQPSSPSRRRPLIGILGPACLENRPQLVMPILVSKVRRDGFLWRSVATHNQKAQGGFVPTPEWYLS
mmetsp:Transcript_55350/g.132196  ORF Transcript_55350/g.132196 Transcript_55350/m.132196 type:complete len:96 (-) Transcript_55350:708-995(-)